MQVAAGIGLFFLQLDAARRGKGEFDLWGEVLGLPRKR